MSNSQKYTNEMVAEEFSKDELIEAMMEATCYEYNRSGFQKMTKLYMAGYLIEDMDSTDETIDIIEHIKAVNN